RRDAAAPGGLPRPPTGDESVPARRRRPPLQAVAPGAGRFRARPGAGRGGRAPDRGVVLRLAAPARAAPGAVRAAAPRPAPARRGTGRGAGRPPDRPALLGGAGRGRTGLRAGG